MATRKALVEHLWESVINAYLEPSALDNIVADCERRPEGPFADTGGIITRMLESGVSREGVCLLQRAAAYEAVFATLYALDDPGVDDDDVLMLHEELLGAEPTGMDGRPGSAQRWLEPRRKGT